MTEVELDEIKKSLHFMSEEISTISKQEQVIMDLMEDLRRQNEEKEKRIALLEE